ncbi:MAG: MerR family transcriptional regulator [Dehalococcoidia bacterium]
MGRPSLLDTGGLLTLQGAAERLGVRPGTLKGWLHKGVVPPPTKYTPSGARLFDDAWIEALAQRLGRNRGGVPAEYK